VNLTTVLLFFISTLFATSPPVIVVAAALEKNRVMDWEIKRAHDRGPTAAANGVGAIGTGGRRILEKHDTSERAGRGSRHVQHPRTLHIESLK
jgi:hypothetical protein